MKYIEKSEELKYKEFICTDNFVANADNKSIYFVLETTPSLIRAGLDELERYEALFKMPVREMVESDYIALSFYTDYNPFTEEISLTGECQGENVPYIDFPIFIDKEEKQRLIILCEGRCMKDIEMSCEAYCRFSEDCK